MRKGSGQIIHDTKVRMPVTMFEDLSEQARKNQRSLSKQVIFCLQELKELKEAQKKKATQVAAK